MENLFTRTKLLGATLLFMLVAFAPGKAFADDNLSSYYYTTDDGSSKQLSSLAGYSFLKVESTTTSFSDNTVYVLTDDDITIDTRITCGKDVILVLLDGKKMTAQRGITVEEGSSITITAGNASDEIYGTGYLLSIGLSSRATAYNAAIGGRDNATCGTVTINNGTVTAYCTNSTESDDSSRGFGAGIGGGRWGSGGTININGGTVTAASSFMVGKGAGIGGGFNGSGGTINISGGVITAASSMGQMGVGAGIGGGVEGSGGTINISGGVITASSSVEQAEGGEYDGAGIGRGHDGSGGTLTITGEPVIEAMGDSAIMCDEAKAVGDVCYRIQYEDNEYVQRDEVDLFDFDDGKSVSNYNYAKITASENFYLVTFIDSDSILKACYVEADSVVESYEYTKEGYTLEGWYADVYLTQKFDFRDGITSDTRLYAVWEVNKYIAIYTINDSAKYISAKYNETFLLPTPTKSGYTFAGWTASEVDSTAMSGTSEEDFTSWDGTATMNNYFKNITTENGAIVAFIATWNENSGSSAGDDEGDQSFSLNVSSYGVATMYLDYPVKIPFDEYDKLLAVGYVCEVTDDEMVLKRLDDYIPANTGVVIFASSGTYTFKQTTEEVEALSDSKLSGVVEAIDTATINGGNGTIYCLGKNTESHYVGFYHYSSAKIPANKAYYLSTDGNSAKYYTFGFASGTNGIEELLYDSGKTAAIGLGNGFYYDLKGQKVTDDATKLPNGIYIKNGRKVVVNKQ